MYTLFAYPNSYAMTVHALMEELAIPYRCKWVPIFTDEPDPELLEVSPHSRVPALQTPDGALFETGAIALYLAERHADGAYTVPVGTPRRGEFLQWFHYFATTLQPDVMIQFHPEVYFADPDTQDRFKRASSQRLEKILDIIDEALVPGPFFMGEQITVLDFLFALQAVWPEMHPGDISDRPAIKHHVDMMLGRPAVRHVYDLHMSKKLDPIKGPPPSDD